MITRCNRQKPDRVARSRTHPAQTLCDLHLDLSPSGLTDEAKVEDYRLAQQHLADRLDKGNDLQACLKVFQLYPFPASPSDRQHGCNPVV
jgi:hypothetical protein